MPRKQMTPGLRARMTLAWRMYVSCPSEHPIIRCKGKFGNGAESFNNTQSANKWHRRMLGWSSRLSCDFPEREPSSSHSRRTSIHLARSRRKGWGRIWLMPSRVSIPGMLLVWEHTKAAEGGLGKYANTCGHDVKWDRIMRAVLRGVSGGSDVPIGHNRNCVVILRRETERYIRLIEWDDVSVELAGRPPGCGPSAEVRHGG